MKMKKFPALAVAGFLSTAMAVSGADPFNVTPEPAEIEAAMNDGIQLKYADSQKIADLKITKGGETRAGNWVYLCTAKLVWKIDSKQFLKDFEAKATAELDKQIAPGSLKELAKSLAPLGVKMVLGDFNVGETIVQLPIRVSLVNAGGDWIVTDSAFPAGFINPVDKLFEKFKK